jgi:hypothetical protein
MTSARPKARPARLRPAPFANARDAIGALSPGVRVVGLTKGQFSMLDMLSAVLEQTGPADVTVSTWTQGKAEMEGVAGLLRTHQITRFRLLVDRSFATRHPGYVKRIHAIAGPASVRQTKTHAKFALISGGDYRITIRTSMNFNHNPRLEQFDLDDDPVIYDFFAAAVEEVFAVVPAGLDVASSKVEAGFDALRFGVDAGRGFDYTGFQFTSCTGFNRT